METRRIQTGLRFRPALIEKLKIKAKRNNKSFNRYVEDLLEKDVATEFPILRRGDFLSGKTYHIQGNKRPVITGEQIDNDPKLAHILGL